MCGPAARDLSCVSIGGTVRIPRAHVFEAWHTTPFRRYGASGPGKAITLDGHDGRDCAAAIGAAIGGRGCYGWRLAAHDRMAPTNVRLCARRVARLMGTIAVEIAKCTPAAALTGDLFVVTICADVVSARVFNGRSRDHTFAPRRAAMGIDFGDGIARHPTNTYEIAFMSRRRRRPARRTLRYGRDRFKLFMLAYLTFSLAVDLEERGTLEGCRDPVGLLLGFRRRAVFKAMARERPAYVAAGLQHGPEVAPL